MSNLKLATFTPNNVTNLCPNGVPIFLNLLDLCVDDVKGWFAVISGIISILAWMVYGIPQMVVNCRQGSIPDEAISPFLLMFWSIGDTCNLVGAILTKQLVLQIVMAGYSLCCDAILVSQFTFAILRKRWRSNVGPQDPLYGNDEEYVDSISVYVAPSGHLHQKSQSGSKIPGMTLFCLSIFCLTFLLHNKIQLDSKYVGRTLLSAEVQPRAPFLEGYREILGYVLGWCSTILYSCSRMPQIIMNFRRKCTEGLSVGLFLFALIGNITYGAQIFLVSTDMTYILKHLPWIIGSWGIMLLDSTIVAQFVIYRHSKRAHYTVLSDLEEDSDIEKIS